MADIPAGGRPKMNIPTPTIAEAGTDAAGSGDGGPGSDPLIEVRKLSKQFVRSGGSVVKAVHEVDLEVRAAEIVCLLGPSGCGKTTLLRCIAGLETPSAGEIVLNGAMVYSSENKRSIPPEKRGISMMFQSYALWPHMSVAKNVGYPLRSRRWDRSKTRARVEEVLDSVGIPELIDQMPGSLSGGQQQRVALARSLAPDPSVILFDEPLSNVDAKVRESLRLEILEMHRRVGFAALYVTHDQEEAMRLGDRVAVLNQGEIADIGTPGRVYAKPRSRYVANFIGSLNEVPGTVTATGSGSISGITVEFAGHVANLQAVTESDDECNTTNLDVGDDVVIGIRPESFHIGEAPCDPTVVKIQGKVIESMFLGSEVECLVEVGEDRLTVRTPIGMPVAPDDPIQFWCLASDIAVFQA